MIDDIAIPVFGLTGVTLALSDSPVCRKWAPIIGMAGQYFWIHSSYTHQLWGMLIANIMYTASWGYGIYVQWVKK